MDDVINYNIKEEKSTKQHTSDKYSNSWWFDCMIRTVRSCLPCSISNSIQWRKQRLLCKTSRV